MKLVVTLLVVQTVLLALLVMKVLGIESRLATASPGQPEATFPAAAMPIRDAPLPDAAPAPAEDRMRRIVREELAAQLDRITAGGGEPGDTGDGNMETRAPVGTPNSDADPYASDAVSRRIDYYVSVGTISDVEMQQLQTEIAKLGEADRRRMLGKLVNALNSGRLDGRL